MQYQSLILENSGYLHFHYIAETDKLQSVFVNIFIFLHFLFFLFHFKRHIFVLFSNSTTKITCFLNFPTEGIISLIKCSLSIQTQKLPLFQIYDKRSVSPDKKKRPLRHFLPGGRFFYS